MTTTKYIPFGTSLQEYFVDKQNGLPLSDGQVFFYSDINRTTSKTVYRQTGVPGAYTYSALPQPVTLTGVGTFSYLGDDIQVFGYPFDDAGNIELYYVQVFDSNNVPQFSREGQPPGLDTSDFTQNGNIINLIPNGQFLAHNNIPANDLVNPKTVIGQVPTGNTIIAPGGWYFKKPNVSNSIDIVTFPNYSQYVTSPNGSPRFSCRIRTTTVDTNDTFKDLALQIMDVNKFSSSSQQYTFAFTAINNNIGTIPIEFVQLKNFGTGGSPSSNAETILTSFNITNNYQIYQLSFIVGSNQSYTLGTNNDDYIEFILRLPSNNLNDFQFDNFIFAEGQLTITDWVIQTNFDMYSRTICGDMPLPDPNGNDLYLPLIRTPSGVQPDNSVIGQLVSFTYETLPIGYLPMDGQGTYETVGYSNDSIPYSRLQSKWWTSDNAPLYGTGIAYVTAIYTAASSSLQITTNTAGSVTDLTDHGTGITIEKIHEGDTGYYIKSYLYLSPQTGVIISDINAGVVTQPTAGTSGFTVSVIRVGLSLTNQISLVTPTAVTTSLRGKYFTFHSYNAGNQSYYVWFKVGNVGSDPAPGGTGIMINLTDGDTSSIAAQKISCALNGFENYYITFPAASSITNSTYFTFSSTTKNYYFWYNKSGGGTDPNVSGAIGIEIDILNGDSASEVALKSQIATNMRFFGTIDIRNFFIKGSGNELDGYRYTSSFGLPSLTINSAGTYQDSTVLEHPHTATGTVTIPDVTGDGFGVKGIIDRTDVASLQDFPLTITINPFGGRSSLPYNFNVKFAVRY